MKIAGVDVGPDYPCRIIAEVSNNHNGSIETAFRIIEQAAMAGADWIKFQAYGVDELCEHRGTDRDGPAPPDRPGMTMGELYSKARTPYAWFPDMIAKCDDLEIPWFSSVLGLD